MQNSHHRRRRWRRLGQKESILFNTHYMKVVVKCAATGGKKGRPRIHFSPSFFLRCVLSLTSPKDPNRTRHKKIIEYLNFRFTCVPLFPPLPNFPLAGKIFRKQNLYPSREWGYFACFLPLLLCTPPHNLLKILGTPFFTSPWCLPHPEKGGCVTCCRKYVCVCVQITTFCAALRGRISAAKDRCEGAP